MSARPVGWKKLMPVPIASRTHGVNALTAKAANPLSGVLSYRVACVSFLDRWSAHLLLCTQRYALCKHASVLQHW